MSKKLEPESGEMVKIRYLHIFERQKSVKIKNLASQIWPKVKIRTFLAPKIHGNQVSKLKVFDSVQV